MPLLPTPGVSFPDDVDPLPDLLRRRTGHDPYSRDRSASNASSNGNGNGTPNRNGSTSGAPSPILQPARSGSYVSRSGSVPAIHFLLGLSNDMNNANHADDEDAERIPSYAESQSEARRNASVSSFRRPRTMSGRLHHARSRSDGTSLYGPASRSRLSLTTVGADLDDPDDLRPRTPDSTSSTDSNPMLTTLSANNLLAQLPPAYKPINPNQTTFLLSGSLIHALESGPAYQLSFGLTPPSFPPTLSNRLHIRRLRAGEIALLSHRAHALSRSYTHNHDAHTPSHLIPLPPILPFDPEVALYDIMKPDWGQRRRRGETCLELRGLRKACLGGCVEIVRVVGLLRGRFGTGKSGAREKWSVRHQAPGKSKRREILTCAPKKEKEVRDRERERQNQQEQEARRARSISVVDGSGSSSRRKLRKRSLANLMMTEPRPVQVQAQAQPPRRKKTEMEWKDAKSGQVIAVESTRLFKDGAEGREEMVPCIEVGEELDQTWRELVLSLWAARIWITGCGGGLK